MPRNIEVKLRIESCENLLPVAQRLTGATPQTIEQDDTFFHARQGRLKLRQFADGSAELIHYHRPDTQAAKASDYVRVPVPDPHALREALARASGVQGRVRKTRWLLMAGRTRVHLDRVLGLGDFLELEVVLRDGESDAAGAEEARQLLQALGLADAPREALAYMDLLALKEPAGAAAGRVEHLLEAGRS